MTVMFLDRQSSVPSVCKARGFSDSSFAAGPVGLHVRQLGVCDMPAVEAHLLKLAPLDRRARFLSHTSDEVIRTYVGRLDPFHDVLIGAFDPSERMVGLAEAHPTAGTQKAEIGITVDVAFRRCGLGQYLVARALGLVFALGALSAEFTFIPSNRAVVCLVQSLGGRIGRTLNCASIDRRAGRLASKAA
jgi:hypothetical protein